MRYVHRLRPIYSSFLSFSLGGSYHSYLLFGSLFSHQFINHSCKSSPPPSSVFISRMVDLPTVCCMCGDIGFPDKIFRCSKCVNRFQHSYCSNYYSESSEPIKLCDWCQTDEIRSAKHGSSSKKSSSKNEVGISNRSEFSGDKIKQHDREEGTEKTAGKTGAPSPRTSTRRYKLLKDVMC